MVKLTDTQQEILALLLTCVLGILISIPLFGSYYLHPNAHMFAFGGDALTLYYNVLWHSWYDHGIRLNSFNYPDGELLFMTDAQGALSTILQWLNHFGLNLRNVAVGIVNGINVYSYLLSLILYFLILRSLGCSRWRTILFVCCISICTPQLPRMIPHHALANTAIFPLCILWLLRKWKIHSFEYRDAGMFFLFLFFIFNNPYIGFSATLFCAGSFLVFIFMQKIAKRYFFLCIGFCILPIVLFYLFIQCNDLVTDRLKQQWGYWYYQASWDGIFFPTNSYWNQFLHILGIKISETPWEGNMPLPTCIVFVIVIALIYFIIIRIRKVKVHFHTGLIGIWVGAFFLFFYSSTKTYNPFNQETIDGILGPLLMFKAVARLAFPFWVVTAIVGVYIFDRYLKSVSVLTQNICISIFIIIGILDYDHHVVPRFKDSCHANFFSTEKLQEVTQTFQNAKIDFKNYQALLLLPRVMSWHDNILSELTFNAQFHGMQISLAGGLPMISALLSRISTSQCAERIELLSNPLIERTFPQKIKDSRPVLLLQGKGGVPLTTGEQYLISISSRLLETDGYILYAMRLSDLNQHALLKLAKQTILPDSVNQAPVYRNGWDDVQSKISYFGGGANDISRGTHTLAKVTLHSEKDSMYLISCWVYLDHEKYGTGKLEAIVRSDLGDETYRSQQELRWSGDVHGGWIRGYLEVPGRRNNTIEVQFHADKQLILDELIVQPKYRHSMIEGKDGSRLFDGIRIQLENQANSPPR